jgi:hypothetical protein
VVDHRLRRGGFSRAALGRVKIAAILIGLTVYGVAFYTTPLSDVPNDKGQPLWRIGLLGQLLLRPDDWVFPYWFGRPPRLVLADRLPVLATAAAIVVWAAMLGWLLLTPLRRGTGQLTRLELVVFSTTVGLSALSTWTLLLGLFGQLGRMWVFVLPALVTVLAAAYLWLREQRNQPNSRRLTAAGKMAGSSIGAGPTSSETVHATSRRLLAAGCCSDDIISLKWLWLALPFVLAVFLAAMLPPLDFDVCEYHLQAPKEFFQQGRIAFLPHNVYANMTLGTEMLSLLAMVVSGDWWLGALAGKTIIAAFTPLCALGLLAAGRRLCSTGVGVVAALVYISVPWMISSPSPAVATSGSAGLVEGASACYLFLSLYAILLATRQQRGEKGFWEGGGSGQSTLRRHRAGGGELALAGYLAGAAVATKYPAALFVLLPLAIWVVVAQLGVRIQGPGARGQEGDTTEGRRGERGEGRGGTEQSRPILLPPSPFPLRRPLNPLIALAVFVLAATLACGLWFGKNWVSTGNPTYPLLYGVFDGKTWNAAKDRQWNQVHRPHDFSPATLGRDLESVVLTSPWLSPLVVPLAVLALVGASRQGSRLVWGLLGYVVFVLAMWWLFTHRIDRFWVPVLSVLALLAGVGAHWSADRWWRWTFRALLLAGLATNFLMASWGPANAWFVPLADLRDDPAWVGDPWHRYFNAHAADGTVLAVGDAAVFDLRPPVLYNTCFDDCIFEQLVKGKSPEEIRAAFAREHIAYVYVNCGEIDRYRRTYGYTNFVQPAVFDHMVTQGILEPLPSIEGHPGRAYRVAIGREISFQGTTTVLPPASLVMPIAR